VKTYIAVESATGDMYRVDAPNTEIVYIAIGRDVLGMKGEIDTGNVDFDIYELPGLGGDVYTPAGYCQKLKQSK
jgi:hypothetical protein